MQDLEILRVTATKSFNDVAPRVRGLRVVMVNVYGVEDEQDWVLVDAALPMSAARIHRWAKDQFGRPPRSIVLTHGHFDHVGALKELADDWDVPIYTHPLEMPYLTGRSQYPPPDPTVGGGAMAAMASLYPRGPIDVSRRLRSLPEDGSLPDLPQWRWIHTPGHTPGHVSLFREDDRTLIAGDAFVTTKQESMSAVISQRTELHGPPAYYTPDWEAAKLSVQRLAGLFPLTMATGHGRPVVGPAALRALEILAEEFDVVARPATGRYVHTPAVQDERGVVSVPPRLRPDPLMMVAVGLGMAALTYVAVSRRSARG